MTPLPKRKQEQIKHTLGKKKDMHMDVSQMIYHDLKIPLQQRLRLDKKKIHNKLEMIKQPRRQIKIMQASF